MIRRLLPLVALVIAPDAAAAQQAKAPADGVSRFVAEARTATERFKDLDVAVAENYVKVGPDFPAMGEHWVNGELIMKNELDPRRPAILTYAVIDGKPTLTGAVYALTLGEGEQPPDVPGSPQWHAHVGTVDEESLLFGHDHHGSSDEIRLVVMHAWVWVANPAGAFATDNWALPFARLGVASPEPVRPNASRAASLLSVGTTYYARLFTSIGELDEDEAARAAAAIERQREVVQRWWDARRSTRPLAASEVAQLEAIWSRLISDVGGSVSPASAARLQRVFVQ